MPKTTLITINHKNFISHAYPVGYALDLLAALASALAKPLSRIFGFAIPGNLEGVAQAMPALRDVGADKLLELLPAFESAGGSRLIVRVLAHTWYEDKPLDSQERLQACFGNELGDGLLDMLQLTWEVLIWNLSPLVSSVARRAKERAEKADKADPPK